jgi:hypothetical protein
VVLMDEGQVRAVDRANRVKAEAIQPR